jgi:hypothetical protein
MAVKYSKEQTEAATAANKKLVTVAAAGLEFSEAVSEDMEAEVIRFILDIRKRFRQTTDPRYTGVLVPGWPQYPASPAAPPAAATDPTGPAPPAPNS